MARFRTKRVALLFVAVLGLTAGCGGGGGDSNQAAVAARGTISGSLLVPPDNAVEAEPNDTPSDAQSLSGITRLSGEAAEDDAGFQAPGLPAGVEIEDLYRITVSDLARVILTIVDDSPAVNDLDLWLLSADGSAWIDVSTGLFSTELIEISTPGDYLIGVQAFSGASAYVLTIETTGAATASAGAVPVNAEFVPGEVLVRFKADPAQTGMKAFGTAARHGLAATEVLPQGVALMRAPVVPQSSARRKLGGLSVDRGRLNALKAFTLDAVRRLRAEPDVAYAEPNFIRRPLAVPNDSEFPRQWHYNLINLPQAWDVTTGDGDVIVAVIDTGVLSGHPDLSGRLVAGYDFVSSVANAGDGDGRDTDPEDAAADHWGSHGTHVAGTIGAVTNNGIGVAGVTWQTRIMPLRVLGLNGGADTDIAQAILYAAGLPNGSGTVPPERARVINMSLGGPAFSQTVKNAIDAARGQGVIVVAAAGNENSSQFVYPASYDGVISVAAVDLLARKAFYSNYGSRIDVAAPGGDMGADFNGDGLPDGVLSTDRDGAGDFTSRFNQGTSMASPHVAGVVALMLAVNPSLTPVDVDRLLTGTHPDTTTRITRDLGAPGRDDLYGHGLIDAAQAVIAAQSVPGGGGTPPTGSILAVSTDTLAFGNFLRSLSIDVTNAGIGSLAVTSVTDDAPWLTVTPSSGTAPLRLTATVDRTGLADGDYSATITITTDASEGDQTATVDVRMSVGGPTLGNVGTVYVLVVDVGTFDTVDQAITSAAQGYAYTTPGARPGTYLVVAGTDRDDDGFICDTGEACGVYPDLVTISSGREASGIDFVVGDALFTESAGLGVAELRGKAFRRLY